MAAGHHFEEPLLASRQVFYALAILDVGRRPVPSHNFMGFVAERLDPEQEPMKDAIGPPQSSFALTSRIMTAESFPFRHQPGEILGMNRNLPATAACLF